MKFKKNFLEDLPNAIKSGFGSIKDFFGGLFSDVESSSAQTVEVISGNLRTIGATGTAGIPSATFDGSGLQGFVSDFGGQLAGTAAGAEAGQGRRR